MVTMQGRSLSCHHTTGGCLLRRGRGWCADQSPGVGLPCCRQSSCHKHQRSPQEPPPMRGSATSFSLPKILHLHCSPKPGWKADSKRKLTHYFCCEMLTVNWPPLACGRVLVIPILKLEAALLAGGAGYLWFLSRELALSCGAVTCVLWAVALRYGGFSRKAQRTYQDALANTNEVAPFSQRLVRSLSIAGQSSMPSLGPLYVQSAHCSLQAVCVACWCMRLMLPLLLHTWPMACPRG